MKTSRFSEPQILALLRQAEGGVPVPELCREHAMSAASFYKWRSKYVTTPIPDSKLATQPGIVVFDGMAHDFAEKLYFIRKHHFIEC